MLLCDVATWSAGLQLKGAEDVSTYLSVAAKWQVYRQAEQVVNKVLKG